MANNSKKYKLADCIGLVWEKIEPTPFDSCDFCSGPLFSDGHWKAKTDRTSYAMLACKACATAAGLEW